MNTKFPISINGRAVKVILPISLLAAIIAGAMYVQRLEDRIVVVEAKEVPQIRGEIGAIRQELKQIQEGDTPYQRRQDENIREIKSLLYGIITNDRRARPGDRP